MAIERVERVFREVNKINIKNKIKSGLGYVAAKFVNVVHRNI
jgi:hypothetical protein